MIQEDKMIERAQEGDQEAFCLLARSYQRRIYALAVHYTRDPHEAEDLSQEVWLKAYRAIGGFRGEAGYYTWLRRITVNTFLNHQREMKTVYSNGKKAFGLGELVSLDELGLTPGENSLTFGGVATLLTGVAILASYIPARRAMKVDPVTALK